MLATILAVLQVSYPASGCSFWREIGTGHFSVIKQCRYFIYLLYFQNSVICILFFYYFMYLIYLSRFCIYCIFFSHIIFLFSYFIHLSFVFDQFYSCFSFMYLIFVSNLFISYFISHISCWYFIYCSAWTKLNIIIGLNHHTTTPPHHPPTTPTAHKLLDQFQAYSNIEIRSTSLEWPN